jgi:hypothetical protein
MMKLVAEKCRRVLSRRVVMIVRSKRGVCPWKKISNQLIDISEFSNSAQAHPVATGQEQAKVQTKNWGAGPGSQEDLPAPSTGAGFTKVLIPQGLTVLDY